MKKLRFSGVGQAHRIIADIVLVYGATLVALMCYYIWFVVYYGDTARAKELFDFYLRSHWVYGGSITGICLLVFSLSGFYSYGKVYSSKYKALLIIQSVTLSYVIVGFLSYFQPQLFLIPRSLFGLSWFFTLMVLLCARAWSMLWREVNRTERRVYGYGRENGKIRNVLVIGGAGYIGSGLLRKLLAKGYNVRLLDELMYGSEPIQDMLNHPKLEIIQGDFRKVHKVVEAMHEIDAVIHLGGLVGDPACALDEDLTIEINLMATRVIAEVAKANRVNRFIFASTCSVYGASHQILDEQSKLSPVSLYAESKIASEQILLELADDCFAPVCLRFGTIYGLSGRTRFDLVVNLLTAKAVVDKKITVFGGDQWRPFLHVDDAGLAVLQALEAPLDVVKDQVFNVGSNDQNYTILEIANLIKKQVPMAELISTDDNADTRNYRVDFSKIKKQLNFVPKWSVEDGIRQVISAFAQGQITDYNHPNYNNAKFLSEAGAYHFRCEGSWAHQMISKIEEMTIKEPLDNTAI